MTVTDSSSPYEKGVASFFGDEAAVAQFGKLVKIEEKLQMMWSAPMIQVYIDFSDVLLSEFFRNSFLITTSRREGRVRETVGGSGSWATIISNRAEIWRPLKCSTRQ